MFVWDIQIVSGCINELIRNLESALCQCPEFVAAPARVQLFYSSSPLNNGRNIQESSVIVFLDDSGGTTLRW